MGNDTLTPLKGDGQGRYRIKVIGNSGAGKTTLGARLSRVLSLPHLPLDRVFWRPNWGKTPKDEFCAAVRAFMDTSNHESGGWIIDGNWTSLLGDMVDNEATDIIWLDPPLALYFPRLVLRTFMRLFRINQPCSPGCDERFTEVFFSRDSIIWWCFTHHSTLRKRETEKVERDRVQGAVVTRDAGGEVVGKRRRIGGWGSEYTAWLNAIEETVKDS